MSDEVIVVVDDEQANLDLLVFLLRAHGYNVWSAMDGERALATIKQRLAIVRRPHHRARAASSQLLGALTDAHAARDILVDLAQGR